MGNSCHQAARYNLPSTAKGIKKKGLFRITTEPGKTAASVHIAQKTPCGRQHQRTHAGHPLLVTISKALAWKCCTRWWWARGIISGRQLKWCFAIKTSPLFPYRLQGCWVSQACGGHHGSSNWLLFSMEFSKKSWEFYAFPTSVHFRDRQESWAAKKLFLL